MRLAKPDFIGIGSEHERWGERQGRATDGSHAASGQGGRAAKSVLRMESRAVEDSDGKCLAAVEDTDTYKRGVQ